MPNFVKDFVLLVGSDGAAPSPLSRSVGQATVQYRPQPPAPDKFYEEVVLTSQIFVIDGETRIEKLLQNAGDDVGAPVALKGFVRFELGEGVDKGEEADFAAEVAAAVSGS